MNHHKHLFMNLDELGTRYPDYSPTYEFSGELIDRMHRKLARCRLVDGTLIQLKNRPWFGRIIEGWLRRADALKLYELAYFAEGDILELGSHHGLSSTILSEASRRSPCRKQLVSIDLDPDCVEMTRHNLARRGLEKGITCLCDDAVAAVQRFAEQGRKFAFVFIDHDHSYGPVHGVCKNLRSIVSDSGFCLFHDFNDERNSLEGDQEYAVYQAVLQGLSPSEFEFCGIYGCTGLFQARASGESRIPVTQWSKAG